MPRLSASALCKAAAKGQIAKVREMISAGAVAKHFQTKTLNAVTEACFGWWGGMDKPEADRLMLVKELVAAGCPVRGDALFRPIDKGERKLLRFLIKHGADVNAVAPKEYYWCVHKGSTPLGLAAQLGQVEMARELLAAGADPNLHINEKFQFGLTCVNSPLVLAANWNQPAMVPLLVKAGADIDAEVGGGAYATAMLTAVALKHVDVIRALIAAGANPHKASNNSGMTPMDLARQRGDPVVVDLLTSAR